MLKHFCHPEIFRNTDDKLINQNNFFCFMVQECYNPEEWRRQLHFERIKPKFNHLIKKFSSYQNELKDFLVEDAMDTQEWSISNTFLVFDNCDFIMFKKRRKSLPDLLGYITILNDSIRLDSSLKETFLKKGIAYKSLPALKIGRLCVDDNYLKRGLGKCLLVWAVYRAAHLNDSSACRFMTLDAKRHVDKEKDSFHFYKKYGFNVLKRRSDRSELEIANQKSGTTPMYLDLYGLIRRIREEK
jgi:predicted GNAT family N-acyltransferase